MKFIANERLTPEGFHQLAEKRGARPRRARKLSLIAARRLEESQEVQTWSDGLETVRMAKPGDWLATNIDRRGEPLRDREGRLDQYVISAEVFEASYDPVGPQQEVGSFGRTYAKRDSVLALPMPEGFDILAPWGERQTVSSGYLLLSGDEVYGVAEAAFLETYAFLDD